MKRRNFVIGAGGLVAGTLLGIEIVSRMGQDSGPPKMLDSKALAEAPNILVFLADDMRWDSLGASGNRIVHTPNLDRLAGESAFFSNAFVTTSICPTSRASIMHGTYANTHGIWDFTSPFSKRQFRRTYHQILRREGYKVGFIGKWGLGGGMPKDSFDFFEGFENLGHYYQPDLLGDDHLTARHGDLGMDFVKRFADKRPFCLTVSFWAPHAQNDQANNEMPFDAQDVHLYKDINIPVAKTFSPNFGENLPEFLHEKWARTLFERRFDTKEKTQKFLKGYYRLVTGMDRAIGRILGEIERAGEMDNTLIIFLSDNGYMLGEHGFGGKWLVYEESIRIPLIIRWPRIGPVANGVRGVIEDFALNIDIAPTILKAAGIEPPSSMEGINLSKPSKRDRFFYEYKLAPFFSLGVRERNWKYAWFPKDRWELLFNLANDPYETRNLAGRPEAQPIRIRFRKAVEDRYRGTPLLAG